MAVAREAQRSALGRHPAVLPPAAVRRPDGRPQLHLAGGGVDHHVPILGLALGERLLELPRLPGLGAGLAHLERLVIVGLEQGRVPQLKVLTGRAVAVAEGLGDLPLRVNRRNPCTDRAGADAVDLGWVGERGTRCAAAREDVQAAAQPVGALPADRLDAAAGADLHLDGAAAVVEAAGAVGQHLDLGPGCGAVPGRCLPAQGRILGIDPGAARLRAVDVDPDEQPGQRLREAQVERIAGSRRHAERHLVGALGAGRAAGDPDVLDRSLALDGVRTGGEDGDGEVLDGLEHDRLLGGRAHGADLGAEGRDGDRLDGRRAQAEPQLGGRGRRRRQADAEQLEQRQMQLVGHPVHPVHEHVRHPGEQLDQRDPGVGHVVLRPLRAGAGDTQAGLVDQVLEPPVVERDLRQWGHAVATPQRGSCRRDTRGSARRSWPAHGR